MDQTRRLDGQHGTNVPNSPNGDVLSSHTSSWPPLEYEVLVWANGPAASMDSAASMGPAASRHFNLNEKYKAAVPPVIANLIPVVDRETGMLAQEAEHELARFDEASGHRLKAFGPILLRSEAASSSQIEHLSASARQIFTAEAGGKGERNASEIVANTRAMLTAIELSNDLSVATVLEMHRVLMDRQPRHTPGLFREDQVWIGKKSESPIGAEYVAPAAGRVPGLMADLAEYASRKDITPLLHVATAHAQFETIHPFSDGNGRTGRALAQGMLRASRLTRNVAVPVSAGLLINIDGYHEALGEYRTGNLSPIVAQFATASLRAVPNGRQLMAELDEVREHWLAVSRPRARSAKLRLLEYAIEHPAFTAEAAALGVGVTHENVYRALRDLQSDGVFALKAGHSGPSVWRAPAVLDAIDRFAERAGRRTLG